MSAKPTKIEQQVRALIDSLEFVIEDDEGATTIIYKENDGEEYHFLIQTRDDDYCVVRGRALTDQWRDALQLFTEIARASK